MKLGSVEPDDVDGVLEEFHELMTAAAFVGPRGVEFAREILAAGLGEDKAEGILSRLNVVYTEVPFASLRNADVRQLVTFLKDEHPQVIALVLAHLTPRSRPRCSRLRPEQQAAVAHRIATMDRTSPEMVRLVEEELGRAMGSLLAHQDMSTVGGVETLVEIINRSPRPTERSILEWLDSTDPELAEQVRAQMFVFEDIVTIDDRSLQLVLREVEANDLATGAQGRAPRRPRQGRPEPLRARRGEPRRGDRAARPGPHPHGRGVAGQGRRRHPHPRGAGRADHLAGRR
jgi:flagellar motor switch protein FliG